MKKEPDILIDQQPKIVNQILKMLPGDMKNQINIPIISIGQMVNNSSGDFDFMAFLQSLPEPRLKNLKCKAINMARTFFNNDVEVAKFFGISYRQLRPSYETKKIEEVPDGDNEPQP